MSKPKTKLIKTSIAGRYARIDIETGIVLGYEYASFPSEKRLSKDIDNLVLDQNGELNGDWVGDYEDEDECDFIELLTDPRHDMD